MLCMGGFKKFNPEGGFSEYLYRQVGEVVTVNGITVKVIAKIDDEDFHSSLPYFSNTSDAYAKLSVSSGHEVEQLRIYVNRKAAIDFDWGHAHRACSEGVVHVHVISGEGHFHADASNVRYMNEKEIATYGPIIKMLNPKARLRP